MRKFKTAIIIGGFFVMLSASRAFAFGAFTFEGKVDLLERWVDVNINLNEEQSVKAKITQTEEDGYHFALNLDHLKMREFELSSEVEGLLETINTNNTVYRGKLWSQYSLVDLKPIDELSGLFEVRDQKLFLQALSFGNINCHGSVGLSMPYNMDLTVNLFAIDMDDFLTFWMPNKTYESAGPVSGEIKISGALNKVYLKGDLRSENGFIKKLNYNNLKLNIEGFYPNMQIADSKLSKTDGMSFTFQGPFDLSDRKNFKRQIKSLSFAPVIKSSSSEAEWTIRRLKADDSGTTDFKYMLRKSDSGSAMLEEESNMLGIERTMEF